MSAWAETTLKKVAEKISYGYTASATEEYTGVKFLRITDIASGAIDWETVPYCEISESDLEKCRLTQGEIVIARTGATVGYAKQIRRNPYQAVFASYLVRVRLKDNVCKRFVGILTESGNYKYYINTIAGGSAQPNANAQDLCSYPFYLPPIHVQQKVAAILSAYDDLIENNQRRIALLEKMAEEIYREWFVRMRFPCYERVKKVKGVPEGWRVERIADLVDRKRFGRIYRESELLSEGDVVVIDQSTKEWLGFYEGKAEHQASPDRPLILFGDHSCKMQLMIEPFSLAENVVPFTSQDEMPIIFLYYLVHSLVETTEYKRHWTDLITKQVFVPTSSLQKQFDEKVRNPIVMARNLKVVNANLRKTRDRLLTRLISGKLSVEKLDIQYPPGMATEMKTEAAHA